MDLETLDLAMSDTPNNILLAALREIAGVLDDDCDPQKIAREALNQFESMSGTLGKLL